MVVGLHSDFTQIAELALGGFWRVWIVSFKLMSLELQVIEGIDFKTSIAPRRLRIAVNELRLRQLQQLSGLNEMSTLNGSGGRECPA